MRPYSLTPPPAGLDSRGEPSGSNSLDQLLHSKSHILRTKLDVLGAELRERVRIWDHNLQRIDGDKERVTETLQRVGRLANYHLRDHREQTELYKEVAGLEQERRSQDVECWRDLVNVMRDFLVAWEAHEQAKSRAIFLDHAGSGSETPL